MLESLPDKFVSAILKLFQRLTPQFRQWYVEIQGQIQFMILCQVWKKKIQYNIHSRELSKCLYVSETIPRQTDICSVHAIYLLKLKIFRFSNHAQNFFNRLPVLVER